MFREHLLRPIDEENIEIGFVSTGCYGRLWNGTPLKMDDCSSTTEPVFLHGARVEQMRDYRDTCVAGDSMVHSNRSDAQ